MRTNTQSTCTAIITLTLPEGTSIRATPMSEPENEWTISFTAVGATDDDAALRIHRTLDALAEQLAP